MDISPKGARELCAWIRGKTVERAIGDLEDVIEKKKAVPYPHYRSVGHRRGKGFGPGRYPVKAAAAVLKVLRSADNNANEMARTEDSSQMKIIHASTSLGRKFEGWYPRAHGRSSPKIKQLVHVEIVLEDPTFEVAED